MYEIYAKLRDEKGLTDYKVAKALNIGTASFSQWKAGKVIPKFNRLVAIADILGVSIDVFAQAAREMSDKQKTDDSFSD